nr:signal peptidase II [Gemmatimonadota bacterium]
DLLAAPLSTRIPAGLVAGGAAGNLIDRARLGFVADFVTLPPLPFFQVFNVADSAITVGGVLLAFALLRRP